MLKNKTTVAIVTSLILATGFFLVDTNHNQNSEATMLTMINSRNLTTENKTIDNNIYEQDNTLNYELKNNVEFLESTKEQRETAIKKKKELELITLEENIKKRTYWNIE